MCLGTVFAINKMPPKRKKFESTFPAARIKKIMQLDDDVGRVASSVPVVISRAVEIFLHSLLRRSAEYAASRSAKTLTVSHLKHCIQCEKQWDFLKELTSKIADLSAEQEEAEENYVPKRGRKRRASPSQGKAPSGKRKKQSQVSKEEESSESEDESPEPPARLVKTDTTGMATSSHRSLPVQLPGSQASTIAVGVPGVVAQVVGGNLSSLTAGLQKAASREDNSDDDYD